MMWSRCGPADLAHAGRMSQLGKARCAHSRVLDAAGIQSDVLAQSEGARRRYLLALTKENHAWRFNYFLKTQHFRETAFDRLRGTDEPVAENRPEHPANFARSLP